MLNISVKDLFYFQILTKKSQLLGGTGWVNQSYISIICECDGQEGCNAAAIPSSLWIANFVAVVTISYILMNTFISSII